MLVAVFDRNHREYTDKLAKREQKLLSKAALVYRPSLGQTQRLAASECGYRSLRMQ